MTTSSLALSVKIQFLGLKGGQIEGETSQAVSQVPFSANKSLQDKYLNEKSKKKITCLANFHQLKIAAGTLDRKM